MNTRTSFMVGRKDWAFFCSLMTKISVKRDIRIALQLEQELNDFEGLNTNSEEDRKIILESLSWGILDKVKVSVVLPKELVNRLNERCKVWNVPRSMFFHRFIEYQNVATFYSAFMLVNPRKTLEQKYYYQWLEKASRSCPALNEYREYYNKIKDDSDHPSHDGGALSDEDILYNYLTKFYQRFLNVATDDERRHEVNKMVPDVNLDDLFSFDVDTEII